MMFTSSAVLGMFIKQLCADLLFKDDVHFLRKSIVAQRAWQLKLCLHAPVLPANVLAASAGFRMFSKLLLPVKLLAKHICFAVDKPL